MEIIEKEESTSMKKDRMVSPRLSFSHDIPQNQLLPSSSSHESNDHNPPVITDFDDFDFTTSLEVSMQEPCSADELFSDGKILPLSLKSKPTTTSTSTSRSTKTKAKQNTTTLKEIIDDDDNEDDQQKKETERKPFWMFARSGSVGSNRTTTMITTTTGTTKQKNNNNNNNICPFRRSKSAGFSSMIKTRSKNYSNKVYYYSGMKTWSHGDGVRINPVINLPRGGSTASCRSNSSNSSSSNNNNNNNNNSSLFSYLLCKCSTKGMEMERSDMFSMI